MQEALVPHVDMSAAKDKDMQPDESVNNVVKPCASKSVGNVDPKVMVCMGLLVPDGGNDQSHLMVDEEEQPAGMELASLMHGKLVSPRES